MKYFLIITIFVLSSCSPSLRQSYKKLSKPEKSWLIFHPLKAKKAFLISKEAVAVKDSISNYGSIGKDNNGGHLDAFKHSYWMARLSQGIGKRAALKLGKAHEKGNYLTFKKQKLEDGYVPDKASSTMDLHNNNFGAVLAYANKKVSRQLLIQQILMALEKGKLRILSKDASGRFLDCKGFIIPKNSLKHRWVNRKCLILSSLK